MLELIKYIVDQFAEDKENVTYDVAEKDRAIEVTISLSPSDMGKVIGRQGKIAKALRTIVRAATPADSKRYVIEIREKGGDRVDGDDGEKAERSLTTQATGFWNGIREKSLFALCAIWEGITNGKAGNRRSAEAAGHPRRNQN